MTKTSLSNITKFYGMMVERECIRLRRKEGKPWPWSSWPEFQKFKFTNVFRKYDRTTQDLIKAHYNKYPQSSTRKVVLLNCAISRFFGVSDFVIKVGWFHKFDKLDKKRLAATAEQALDEGEKVFTDAYIVSNGGVSKPKSEVVVYTYLTDLWKHADDICSVVENTASWEKVAERLKHVHGFGGTGFMAKEVILDTMLCKGFWPTKTGMPKDYAKWTPCGPGARRGLNRIFGRDLKAKPNAAQMLEEIRQICDMQPEFWPKDFGRLSPTDIQFQLCEFDKFLRIKSGKGTVRKYRYEENK